MSKQLLKQISPLTHVWVDEPKTMSDKKQSSVDWLIEQIHYDANKRCLSLAEWNEIFKQAKAKHKQEIKEAYDRKVIGDIQDWYIRNGKHYYELHYKEEQVGE